jgi:CRP-like cAMP-binding protein
VLAIFVTTLYQHGLDPISLIATGSVLTAVVGFALQGTIANVFAGLALPLEGEFAIGDWVEVGGHVGRIREIKWRSTALVTKDGDTVIVPNNFLITTSVKNYSRPTTVHRVWIRVGFHDRHPPNDVRDMVLDAVRRVPSVLAEPPPDCLAVEFGDDSITYAVRFWIDGFAQADPIAAEVRTRLWYASRRAGFEMPSPSTTVIMETPGTDDGARGRAKALDRVDLFSPLDPDSRAHLANALREQHFGAGEDIIRQDAPGDSLFIIDRGLVDVQVQVDGAHRSLAQLRPGEFFGEMSLMTGAPRQATCTAVTDTVCYVLDQASFRCVLDTRPSLAEDISNILADRQEELTASRDDLSAEARVRGVRDTRSRILDAIRRAFQI